jgi:hypothetical protein
MDAWHELVIEGPAHGAEQAVRAFVAGFVAGRGAEPGSVLVGADVPLTHPTVVERLRALVRGGSHAVVFVTDALLRPLGEALAQQGAAAGLRLEHARPVHRAAFHFTAEAFSREIAADIRAALARLPPGVQVEGRTETEEEHPDVEGVELYAPVHRYAYRVAGDVVGTLSGVLAVHRALGAIEVVEAGPIEVRS